MLDQRVSSFGFDFYVQSNETFFLQTKAIADLQIARPIVRFTEEIDIQNTGSLAYLKPLSFAWKEGYAGEIYNHLELADINLRTHKVVENWDEIELSLVLHNWGAIQLPFGHWHINLPWEGVFKLDHINYLKQ